MLVTVPTVANSMLDFVISKSPEFIGYTVATRYDAEYVVIGLRYIDTVCNTIRMFSHTIQKLFICGRDMVGSVFNQ